MSRRWRSQLSDALVALQKEPQITVSDAHERLLSKLRPVINPDESAELETVDLRSLFESYQLIQPNEIPLDTLHKSVQDISPNSRTNSNSGAQSVQIRLIGLLGVGVGTSAIKNSNFCSPIPHISKASNNNGDKNHISSEVLAYLSDEMASAVTILQTANDLKEYIDKMIFAIYSDRKILLESVDEACENFSADDIQSIIETVRTLSERQWSPDDFALFSGEEFEQLIQKFFQHRGYNTIYTRSSHDKGVDLIVGDESVAILVQAKCYANRSVTSPEVLQYAGLITLFRDSVDRVLVLTSSSYTGPALQIGTFIGEEMQLIAGESLANNFTDSDILPPLETVNGKLKDYS